MKELVLCPYNGAARAFKHVTRVDLNDGVLEIYTELYGNPEVHGICLRPGDSWMISSMTN